MGSDELAARPTLASWLDEYVSIRRDQVSYLKSMELDFADVDSDVAQVEELKHRLAEKGARFRNGDASISTGPLSSACLACSTGLGSKTFVLSMKCNRSCYFCFNLNQDERNCQKFDWRKELDGFSSSRDGKATHLGLSGGEPLLHPREAVEFVRRARKQNPDSHIRLYTAGDFLDDKLLGELADAGLNELRMSVKLDVEDLDRADGLIEEAVARLRKARAYIKDVLVEMPIIPGTGDAMRSLLLRLEEEGVFGINLLEFGFPLGNWEPFARRGFRLKNPPFRVAYDYSYPAGLPVLGSELLCLELLEFALDRSLSMGVHYCSLENKNRGQVFRQNSEIAFEAAVYELDEDDFFYKTAKVFDGDVEAVRNRLEENLRPFSFDQDDGSLSFHPDDISLVDDLPVCVAVSSSVVERTANSCVLREVFLELAKGKEMERESWAIRAAAWELAALGFRYPDAVLAESIANGEWFEAAAEIMQLLGMELPEGWDEGSRELACTDAESIMHELRIESTRLLVGAPTPVVFPYEGAYLSQKEGKQPLLYIDPRSMEVERFVHSCGMRKPDGSNEPLDHIATECELMQYLASLEAGLIEPGQGGLAAADYPGGSCAQAYEMFFEEHLRAWVRQFCDDVAAKTRCSFYCSAAAFLKALVELT